MVLKPEPIFAAVQSLVGANRRESIPNGKACGVAFRRRQAFTQTLPLIRELRTVVLICGRYEGVDERVADALVTDEVSVGDYVLSAANPRAGVIDATVRLLPGALGSETSTVNESFQMVVGLPQYTRPPEF